MPTPARQALRDTLLAHIARVGQGRPDLAFATHRTLGEFDQTFRGPSRDEAVAAHAALLAYRFTLRAQYRPRTPSALQPLPHHPQDRGDRLLDPQIGGVDDHGI